MEQQPWTAVEDLVISFVRFHDSIMVKAHCMLQDNILLQYFLGASVS